MTFGAAAAKYFDMGLDAVEIVIATEDAFDISIENTEAEKILTPRQLIDLVQSKVSAASASVCLTQRAFNLLRKSLLRQGNWQRPEIKPTARLSLLIPRDQRRRLMDKLIAEFGIKKPPEFVRARWLNMMLLASSLLAGAFAAIATDTVLSSLATWVFIGVAILTAGLALRLTKPLCQEFPPNLQTVGDLARWVMTHKSDLAQTAIPGWTRDQIAGRVREIIVDVLGCKPDFSEDANFVKDLGLS